jgi:hypothetical protein
MAAFSVADTSLGVGLRSSTQGPTGLGYGVYKDSIDYGVFCGDWLIGRIYERKGFPDDVRFSCRCTALRWVGRGAE